MEIFTPIKEKIMTNFDTPVNPFIDGLLSMYDGPIQNILEFSNVEMLTSSHISNLMILNNLLEGRKLILCNVPFQVKCVFTVCGLREVFNFADDKSAAMAFLQHTDNCWADKNV